MSRALKRLMASQMWGVSATDPGTFTAVVLVTLVAGLAACLLPAQRATRVNRLIALRSEWVVRPASVLWSEESLFVCLPRE